MKDCNSYPVSMIIPNNISYVALGKEFVRSFLELRSIDKSLSKKITLITEEALSHTIKHSYEEDEIGEIRLSIYTDGNEVRLSFYDKGIPFDPSEIESYDPKKVDLTNLKIETLSLFLMEKIADKVMWLNHGKNGKELQILFKLQLKDIKEITKKEQLEVYRGKLKPAQNQNYSIHKPSDREFIQISKCVYKSYGYTYPNEDMYYPDRIKILNEQGKLISVVATDESGEVVGHYALERYNLGNIAETGQAIVDPRHRGRGLMKKMRSKLEEIAKELGIEGIYGQPVTSHTLSQMVNRYFGSKPFGVSLAFVPQSFKIKRIKNKLPQRETCMYYFKPLVKPKSQEIYLYEEYVDIVKFIYSNAKFPKYEYLKSKRFFKRDNSVVKTNYYTSWGFGTITVEKIGKDAIDLIKKGLFYLIMKGHADVVYLFLPLSDHGCDIITKEAKKLGFIFSGVAPFYFRGKDALKMQFLNYEFNFREIMVEGEDAKKILSFIEKEYNNSNVIV